MQKSFHDILCILSEMIRKFWHARRKINIIRKKDRLAEHRKLADKMAEKGAVLTEFPLGAAPDSGHFPRRNRLIAALSLGVVVVEALERSGALITAGLAAEQGRDVFAVPGSIFSPLSRGPHRLLKQGAKLVESASDVLDEIAAFHDLLEPRPVAGGPAPFPIREGLSAPGRSLLAALSLEPAGIDALAQQTGLTAAAAARELLVLELAGWARALPGKQFVCSERSLTPD
jgi:DNA processing protein